MKRAIKALLGATVVTLSLAACDKDAPTLYTNLGGPIYDFRVAVDASAAAALPGGTVNTYTHPGILDSLRLTLRGLPAVSGGYTVFSVDDNAKTSTVARTGVTPDSLGRVTVTITGASFPSGTSVVVGFGGATLAAASAPLYFQFRNPTTGAFTASGSLSLGQFSTTTSRKFVMPTATKWGRGGLWMDEPTEGDIWLRGYVQHVPLAPNGFRYNAWAIDLRVDTIKQAIRIGELTDSLNAAFASHEAAPPNAPIATELGWSVFDAKESALNVDLTTFTHLYITLEPAGATPTLPSPAVLYKATFPRQFTLKRPS